MYRNNDHCILEPAPIWVGLLQERQTHISQVSIDPKAPKVFWQPHRDNKSSKVCFFPPVFASKPHRVSGSIFYQCLGWCSIFITSFLLKIMVQSSENPWQMLQIAQGIIHTFMVHCVFYWGHGPASGTQRKIWSLTNRNLSMMRFFAHFP